MGEYFSRREGFSLPEGEQVDDLNKRTRNRIAFVLIEFKVVAHWEKIADAFFNVSGVLPVRLQLHLSEYDWSSNRDRIFTLLIENYVVKSKWNNIIDLLEIVYADLKTKLLKRQYEKQVNHLFSEEIVRWRMVDGKFERIIEQVEIIRKAEKNLIDPKLKKANQHFQKAWAVFHKRPNPELDDCIRNAWDAVEVVAKHYAGLKVGKFGEALPILVEKGIVIKDWKATINTFYGLANTWVRHPPTTPLPCKIDDAEMFLIFASQIIIYMVSRYKQVKV